uniref:Uncharacterized protein n=1 Tax=Oryza sativa subsp. japonica TaxID=39947 RepID=Q109J6_ORYSJ|nr:hypothetical protein LOC_Os10g33634 [Oryza sativa Japonica Group]
MAASPAMPSAAARGSVLLG